MRKSICIFFLFLLVSGIVCVAGSLQVLSTQWLSDGALEITLDGTTRENWAPAMRESIEITPPVNFRVMRIENQVRIKGDFQPGSYYELLLKRGFPNSLAGEGLPEDQLLRFITNDIPTQAGWLTSGVFYPMHASSWELPFYEVNLETPLSITLSRLYRNSLLHFISSTKVWNGETTRVVDEKIVNLQSLTNHRKISSISLSELGVERKPGIYAIGLDYGQKKDGQYPATLRLAVTDLSLFLFQNGQNYHCFVFSLQHPDKPCSGVSVYLYSEKQQLICDDITDNNGYVRLSLPPMWDPADHPHYVVATDEAEQDSVWVLVDGNNIKPTIPNASNRAIPSILYADRGVCRRGAKMSFTGLLRKGDGGVCSAMPVEIVVTSPEGDEVFVKECQTDNFGFVSAEMTIDSEAPIGQYHAVLRPPRKSRGYTFTYAEMDFEVIHLTRALAESTLQVEQTSPDIWSYEGEIYDRNGRPVVDASVATDVEIRSSDFIPPEEYRSYDFSLSKENHSTGFHFEDKTDSSGVFSGVTAVATSALQDAFYHAPLEIDIRSVAKLPGNENGEVILTKSFQYHIFDYYLGVRMTEEPGGIPVAHFCALRPDGTEYPLTECSFDYLLSSFKWEYRLVCDHEGKYQRVWQRTKNLVSSGEITLDEQNSFTFSPLTSGNYELEILDHGLKRHLARATFAIGSEDISVPPIPATELVFRMDRESYSPGETAMISFESLFSGVLHCVVGGQGSVVKHFHQSLKEGLNTIQVQIPQDCSGGACFLSVQAVAVGRSGVNTEAMPCVSGEAEIPLVQKPHYVKVNISCPEEVAPNSTVPVQISLTDASGNPVAGRVSLWGVDDSLLQLSGYVHPMPYKDIFENTQSPFTMHSTYSSLYPVVKVENERVGGDDVSVDPLSRGILLQEFMQSFQNKSAEECMSPQVFADVSANPDEPTFVNVHFPADECQFRLMAVASATSGVGGNEMLIQVKENVQVVIEAPSAMLPGDKGDFRVCLLNRQSNTEWFSWHLEILTPKYSARLPIKDEGYLNIPMGETRMISKELDLPKDIPMGEMVVRFAIEVSDGVIKQTDYVIKIRQSIPSLQGISFQYVVPGATSEPFTADENEKSIVRIGALQHQLWAHQAWMNSVSYESLEQKMASLFADIHLMLLEEKGLLKPLASEQEQPLVGSELDHLSFYHIGNGVYSRYLGGDSGWLLGASRVLATEVLANVLCEYPMSAERRQEIVRSLKNFLKNDSDSPEVRAYACCSLALLGDINFYPHSLSLLGDEKATALDRYVVGMALVMGGRYAQAHEREAEGQAYVDQGLTIVHELTPENFVEVCSRNSQLDESSTLCNMSMVIWVASMMTPDDPVLDELFAQCMDRLAKCSSTRIYRMHSLLVGAISEYLVARGDKLAIGDNVHGVLVRPEDGKERHAISADDLPMTVFENGTYCLHNTGELPLVVIRYKDEEQDLEGAQGIRVTQTYRNEAGEEIQSCKMGDLVTVRVAIESPAQEDLELEFQIPAGFQIEEPGFQGRFMGEMQLASKPISPGIVLHSLEKSAEALNWFGDIVWPGQAPTAVSTAYYEYHLRATSPGKFHLPPTIATITNGQVSKKVFEGPRQIFTIEK